MKILLINTLYRPDFFGGAELSVQYLAEALVISGNGVSVVTSSLNGRNVTEEINGVRVHRFPQPNIYTWPGIPRNRPSRLLWHLVDNYNPFATGRMAGIVKMERPDIVHTNTISGFSVSSWAAAARLHVPIVHTLRDYYLLCPRTTMFRNGRNCEAQCGACFAASLLKRKTAGFVSGVAGVSDSILNRHLENGFFGNACVKTVVYNALAHTPSAQLRALPTSGGRIVLGFLGRLAPSKGIETLLQLAKEMPRDRYEFVFGGTGDKAYEDEIKRNFGGDNVRFLGFVKADDFFRMIHFLIVPSLWQEPFGRTTIEAFANGIPVVGSRRGGIPELIDAGNTGFLFDPDQPDELRRILRDLSFDGYEQMKERCLSKSWEFTAERIASKYMSVYESVIQGAATRQPGN